MSTEREALNKALIALEAIADEMTVGDRFTNAGQHLLDTLEPVRLAIAKPVAEPVRQVLVTLPKSGVAAWFDVDKTAFDTYTYEATHQTRVLYAAPQPVADGLTDEQVDMLIGDADGVWHEDVFHIGGSALSCLLRTTAEFVAQPVAAEPGGYTPQVGEAAQSYVARFAPYMHPLPGHWRWQELWDAMRGASPIAYADARDAERYRQLRRGQHWSVIDGAGDTLRGDELDSRVDAARATPPTPA